jgi:hypothetical protein
MRSSSFWKKSRRSDYTPAAVTAVWFTPGFCYSADSLKYPRPDIFKLGEFAEVLFQEAGLMSSSTFDFKRQ